MKSSNMGCECSKPADGMMAGTQPEEIWPSHYFSFFQQGASYQQGADGKPYVIFVLFCCFKRYQELSEALKPNQDLGQFMQYGQMHGLRRGLLFEVKEAQKKIRQLALDNGIEITYECFEYSAQGTGMSMNRT